MNSILNKNKKNQNDTNNSQMPNHKLEKKININKYESLGTGAVSMKKLGFGLWWIKNKKKLRISLVILLTLISTTSWGYTFINFGHYLFKGMKEDEKMLYELVQKRTISNKDLVSIGPSNLSFSSVGIIKSEDTYDLYIMAFNPNLKYWGTFNYCFLKGVEEIDCGESFIFPDEKKYILSLAKDLGGNPNNVKFILKGTSWSRISPHDIPNWEQYKKEHLDIEVKDLKFGDADASELSEKINLNTLSFKVRNNTAYNYRETPFTILLYRTNKIIGVNRYIIKDFYSNKEKEIKITWSGNINSNKEIVIPDLNIMDKNIYLNP